MASHIQQGLLPKIYRWKDLEFGYFYKPMLKVSGDYFDIILLPENRCGVLMADVSGHGIPACLITSMGKLSFVTNSLKSHSPSTILDHVNLDLNRHVKTQDYMTAFFIIFDENYNFQYTNASHQMAIHVTSDGEITELDTDGFFLGVDLDMDIIEYETKKSILKENESLVLYTDGIIDMRNKSGEIFGKERIQKFVKNNYKLGAKTHANEFENYFYGFIDKDNIIDDTTFLVISRKN